MLDIPIFHRVYELYKLLDGYRGSIAKAKRYTLWQKCENITLVLLEKIIACGHQYGEEQMRTLYFVSDRLDLLKVLVRLAKETHTITSKQYLAIQEILQDIGKMLGGWIKSVSR